jgi:hypothetical protein
MHSIKKATTLATLFVMECVDIINSICVMIISQRSCKLVEKILRDLVSINRNIFKCNSSKMKYLFISIYTLILYLFKVWVTFAYVRNKQFTITMAPVVASAMIIASESLLFVLCVQLQKYLYYINLNLRNASNLGHFQVAKLTQAFEMISNAQKDINHVFGPFLLFNLSQIIFFLLYVPVLFIFSCNNTDNYETDCDFTKWIYMGFLFLTFFLRLSMIIWGCNIVTNEVSKNDMPLNFALIFFFFCLLIFIFIT